MTPPAPLAALERLEQMARVGAQHPTSARANPDQSAQVRDDVAALRAALTEGAEAVEVLRAWGEAEADNETPGYDWVRRSGLKNSSTTFCAAAWHEEKRAGFFVPAHITREMVDAAEQRSRRADEAQKAARALADRLTTRPSAEGAK